MWDHRLREGLIRVLLMGLLVRMHVLLVWGRVRRLRLLRVERVLVGRGVGRLRERRGLLRVEVHGVWRHTMNRGCV